MIVIDVEKTWFEALVNTKMNGTTRKELSCVMICYDIFGTLGCSHACLSLASAFLKQPILSRLKRNIMVHISAQYVSA